MKKNMGENVRNGTQTLGTTAVVIVPVLMKGQRTTLVIVNTSTSGQTISLSWGPEAIAGRGVVVFPGGSWSESRDSVFVPSNETVWGIADAASATIAVHERVKAGGP